MILDTDALIDLKRKHPPALVWLATLAAPHVVNGIAAVELLQVNWDKLKSPPSPGIIFLVHAESQFSATPPCTPSMHTAPVNYKSRSQ